MQKVSILYDWDRYSGSFCVKVSFYRCKRVTYFMQKVSFWYDWDRCSGSICVKGKFLQVFRKR